MSRTRKIVLTVLLTPVIAIALFLSVAAYLLYFAPVEPAKPGTVRVACVGDSITFGNPFSPTSRYPTQLQEMLGDGYSVRNFGAPGYTAQKSGDHSYWEHRYFKLSSEFAPNIVVLMIGSNDAKPQNWVSVDQFTADYRALVAHYQSLPGNPRIVLMTPPTTFLNGRSRLPGKINGTTVDTIAQTVKRIGAEMGLAVIDVHSITAPHAEFFTWDGLHPNGGGQRLISSAVFGLLAKPSP